MIVEADAPWHVDALLCIVYIAAAAAEHVNIALLGHSVPRWFKAIGFTGLGVILGYVLLSTGNIPIPLRSLPFLMLIGAGSIWAAVHQWRIAKLQLRCLNNPELRCDREDRLKVMMMQRREP